jgi:predicted anti-sigma-YlaC factor YlaD
MMALSAHCRKATELIEERDLHPLGTVGRLRLWMHLRICDACRAYARQSAVLDVLLQHRQHAPTDTQALQQRILDRLPG